MYSDLVYSKWFNNFNDNNFYNNNFNYNNLSNTNFNGNDFNNNNFNNNLLMIYNDLIWVEICKMVHANSVRMCINPALFCTSTVMYISEALLCTLVKHCYVHSRALLRTQLSTVIYISQALLCT